MHRKLCQRLLAEEVELANKRPVRERLAGELTIDELTVLAPVRAGDRDYLLALAGENYNATPLSLSVHDPASGEELEQDGWPPGVNDGIHPVTNLPFCCMRGLAEYYIHPSHIAERWDRHRATHRLDVLLGHLLTRIGVPG
jgi:hypothetical protein